MKMVHHFRRVILQVVGVFLGQRLLHPRPLTAVTTHRHAVLSYCNFFDVNYDNHLPDFLYGISSYNLCLLQA